MNANKVSPETQNQGYAIAYIRLKQSLINYLRSRLDDPSMAEDIVHDAFLKALLHSSEIRDMDAWLKRIVHNALVDHYRSKRVHKADTQAHDFDSSSDNEPNNSVHSEQTEMEVHHLFAQFLRPFVDCLPSNYSKVLIKKEYEGKTVKQIADELGLSEAAVKSRLSRGRMQLKEQLHKCCEIELDAGIVQDFTPRAC